MLTWPARRQVRAFGRTYGYDVTYIEEMLDAGGVAAVRPLMALQKLAHGYRAAPPVLLTGAAITAAILGDCGPCAQLGVTMFERAGIDPALLRAVAAGDRAAMPEEARLGSDFARATLARDGSDVPLRDEIVRRYGRRALIALAYAITASQAYPNLKYALGHGHACVRLTVAGEAVPTAREPVRT